MARVMLTISFHKIVISYQGRKTMFFWHEPKGAQPEGEC